MQLNTRWLQHLLEYLLVPSISIHLPLYFVFNQQAQKDLYCYIVRWQSFRWHHHGEFQYICPSSVATGCWCKGSIMLRNQWLNPPANQWQTAFWLCFLVPAWPLWNHSQVAPKNGIGLTQLSPTYASRNAMEPGLNLAETVLLEKGHTFMLPQQCQKMSAIQCFCPDENNNFICASPDEWHNAKILVFVLA